MAIFLPPTPTQSQAGSTQWLDYYFRLNQYLTGIATISWATISKVGSDLVDLATRKHNDLTDFQGGAANDYYHLTLAQRTTALDKAHNNTTGIQGGAAGDYYHLTSAQRTTALDKSHNNTTGIQGGSAGNYYHLTSAQVTLLTNATSAGNVTGSRGGNVALANLLTVLASQGIITDSTVI